MLSSKRSGSDALAWWVVALGAIATLWILRTNYPETFGPLARAVLPSQKPLNGQLVFVAGGRIKTVQYTITALFFSVIAGIMLGLMRTVRHAFLRLPASIYIEFIRGIPLLVLLFCTYYGLNRDFEVYGSVVVHVPRFWAAVAGLVICYSAYIGEIIRAGIESIPKEQIEAAFLEGGHRQAARYVILPLAIRKTLPAIGNEFIALLKDSALLSVIAIRELTLTAKNHATATFNYFETYLFVALIYLLVTLVLSKGVQILEKKWDVGT